MVMATAGRGAAAQASRSGYRARPGEADHDRASEGDGTLDTVVTQGRVRPMGTATTASQGTVGAADLALRPLLRPAEWWKTFPE